MLHGLLLGEGLSKKTIVILIRTSFSRRIRMSKVDLGAVNLGKLGELTAIVKGDRLEHLSSIVFNGVLKGTAASADMIV
ncbi:hypothetical protein CPZ13_08425 [Lacticaseibacillus paracasei]|nr:hypothetical protein CPZ13_08425 [Lacticaseibacillus paracasei]RND36500.1 hypothetical protein FAM10859_01769 [Lacticaseibacillus paracasei]RND50563.1 hypothetical protein FAM18108_00207 [Lacticaseibacillus paracasei]